MLAEPFFDLFSLGCGHDAPPFYLTGPFTIFGHHVGSLIENLDQAIRLCPLKAE